MKQQNKKEKKKSKMHQFGKEKMLKRNNIAYPLALGL